MCCLIFWGSPWRIQERIYAITGNFNARVNCNVYCSWTWRELCWKENGRHRMISWCRRRKGYQYYEREYQDWMRRWNNVEPGSCNDKTRQNGDLNLEKRMFIGEKAIASIIYYDEKWYDFVDNCPFWFFTRIFFLTIQKVHWNLDFLPFSIPGWHMKWFS